MSAPVQNEWPDAPTVEYVRERFCKLMAWAVEQSGGFEYASDCFCGQGGFWGSGRYNGTFEDGYRNEGKAVMWIEAAAYACAGMSDPEDVIRVLRAESDAYADAATLTVQAGIETKGGLVDAVRALIEERDALRLDLASIGVRKTWNECAQATPQIRQTKADISNELDACIEIARAALSRSAS